MATTGTGSLTSSLEADLYTLRLPITTVFEEPFPGTNDTLSFALSGILIGTA